MGAVASSRWMRPGMSFCIKTSVTFPKPRVRPYAGGDAGAGISNQGEHEGSDGELGTKVLRVVVHGLQLPHGCLLQRTAVTHASITSNRAGDLFVNIIGGR